MAKLTEPQIQQRAAGFCTIERQIRRSKQRGWPRPCPSGGCSECRGLVQIAELAQETSAEMAAAFDRSALSAQPVPDQPVPSPTDAKTGEV